MIDDEGKLNRLIEHQGDELGNATIGRVKYRVAKPGGFGEWRGGAGDANARG